MIITIDEDALRSEVRKFIPQPKTAEAIINAIKLAGHCEDWPAPIPLRENGQKAMSGENKGVVWAPSRYHRRVEAGWLDVYDVLALFGVVNPGVQHAIKKLLMPGLRGAKAAEQDLWEAKQSVERAIELEKKYGHEKTGDNRSERF